LRPAWFIKRGVKMGLFRPCARGQGGWVLRGFRPFLNQGATRSKTVAVHEGKLRLSGGMQKKRVVEGGVAVMGLGIETLIYAPPWEPLLAQVWGGGGGHVARDSEV